MNPQTIARYENTYRNSIEKWGLDWRIAYVYAYLDAWLFQATGQGAPNIISGYRSPAYQRSLYERWLAGDPSIAYMPAKQSRHTIGQAIDVHTSAANFGVFRDLWRYWLTDTYGVVGEDFGDPGHFAIKTGDSIPVAY